VRVLHHHSSTDFTTDVDHTAVVYNDLTPVMVINGKVNGLVADVRLPDIGKPFALSTRNEFIVMSPSTGSTETAAAAATPTLSSAELSSPPSDIVGLVGRRSEHKPTAGTAPATMAAAMRPSLQAARPREWNSKRSIRTSVVIMVIGG
jgi:hypothetical protein